MSSTSQFNTIEEALQDLREGKIIIVVDDPGRENEGDFIMVGDLVTPESINFMAKHGRGLICMSVHEEIAQRLNLQLMEQANTSVHKTPFTVSIDSLHGTTTGISAHDRAKTILDVVTPTSKPEDFARPGHIFPLVARQGGVLERTGHTEATQDLARLAGFTPAGILCEIMDEDGSMARVPRLMEIAKEFSMKIITIEDLIEYRLERENFVLPVGAPVAIHGKVDGFVLHTYENSLNGDRHYALVKGKPDPAKPLLVRVHTEDLMKDVFFSLLNDNPSTVTQALRHIDAEGCGVLLYLQGEERKAVASLDGPAVAMNKPLRQYGIGAQILRSLGAQKLRVMTSNPTKLVGLRAWDLEIVEHVSI
jgi:3,4-dihydroxy 2-butanone 4-phosphate synthase/GTP cyclohydrolase II